ncbi:hypothetical protein TNCV_4671191 [Trichonephila clavipes]|nr:hypothetical protein TNCV_4671191 [Trichonephila clavipes]
MIQECEMRDHYLRHTGKAPCRAPGVLGMSRRYLLFVAGSLQIGRHDLIYRRVIRKGRLQNSTTGRSDKKELPRASGQIWSKKLLPNKLGLVPTPETGRRKIIDQHDDVGRLNKVNLAGFYHSEVKIWTFPIHDIRDDFFGQCETIVPNTQRGHTLDVERDFIISLGSGH